MIALKHFSLAGAMTILSPLLSFYYIFNSVLMFRISSEGEAPATWLGEKWSIINLKEAEFFAGWDLLDKCNDLFIVKSSDYFLLAAFFFSCMSLRLKFVRWQIWNKNDYVFSSSSLHSKAPANELWENLSMLNEETALDCWIYF